MRKIVHVDMDAFYASVEQRDDPALRGRPVVVAWRGQRSVVCAASYEARKFGVRSAMPAVRAERLCPQAVFVAPDFSRYKAVSTHVREIFARYTELIEPLSLDEAYLDVTQNQLDLPSATAVAVHIRAAIREELNLTASAGISANKFLAKIASDWRKPDGQYVIRPERAVSFLAPLPVGKLPGVGAVMERRLHALGLRLVADLRTCGAAELQSHFGSWGLRLHQLSQGQDERPVKAERPSQSVSSEDTFAEDLPITELEAAIRELAQRTWNAARRRGRSARTVVLKLKTSDFRLLTRSLSPPHPPSRVEALIDIALALRERVELPPLTRYRLVGVGLANFLDDDDAMPQPELFE